jgi:hypothetical protein
MKTTQLKTGIICFLAALYLNGSAQAGFGEIRGIIKDTELQPVPFATIKILQGNQLIGGTQSDAEGRYKYKPLTPGSYEMLVMEAAHQTQPVNKISVAPNEATYVDVKMTLNSLTTVTVTAKAVDYSRSGVDKNMYVMKTLDAKELMQVAGYSSGNVKDVLKSISSDVIEEPNGDVHVRGARGDATAYYVDGVRTIGATSVPGLAIENLTFFSGGVPAMYGDLTSGAVMVTTKTYFSGIRDKNLRIIALKEKQEEKKAAEKAKQDEEKRKTEIEREKLLDRDK